MSSASYGVLRVIFPFAVRWLMARMFFNVSSVIPCCLPKILATRLLVCSVSKATRTSSQARRASLERIRLSIAVSIIGVRSSLYCMFTLFWRACLRRDDAVLEAVNPSCSAIRWSSRLTMGSTHKVRCTVFRLGLDLFLIEQLRCSIHAGALGFHVVQAEPCLCGRMKSALYLALPKR
jgi:hypothetical protein